MEFVLDKSQNMSKDLQQVKSIAVFVQYTSPQTKYSVLVVIESIVLKREVDGSNAPLK